MKKYFFRIVGISLVLFFSSQAPAAIRTVHFAGMVSTWINYINLNKSNIEGIINRYSCTIALVNIGSTSQKITDIKFYTPYWDSSAHTTVKFAAAAGRTPDFDTIYDPATGNMAAPVCDNVPCADGAHELKAGGIYMATILTAPIPMKGNLGALCGGYVTVKDWDDTTPGSVIATGSLTYINEHAIMGGQFQGALYLSGSPINPNNPSLADSSDASYPIKHYPTEAGITSTSAVSAGGYNMNMQCYNACMKSPNSGTTALCTALCGNFNDGTSEASTLGILDDPSTGETKYILKTANPLWSGGRVVEVIAGPFSSICSGNRGYFDHGGYDFNHSDSVFWDAGWKGAYSSNVTGFPRTADYPSERLYCAHSHLQPPPHGYETAGIPFNINGGMPF